MSYRELRNFAEIMRTLGYKRVISLENFRKPNFELVADTLYHMIKLYEPDTPIRLEIEEESDRVEFLTSIATFLAAKARLKLNTKKLYASDGKAVQELLKLATLLFKATRTAMKSSLEDTIPPPIKVQDVKDVRQLAVDITKSGAKLSDLLQNEHQNHGDRIRALRFLDQMGSATEGTREYAYIERSIRDQIEGTKEALEDMRKESEALEADERGMEIKIKKKQEELERTEKRLEQLETAKPQFMDEVEKLENELRYHYDIYMEKYRNLDYLERELEKYHKQEEERKVQQEKRLERMRQRLNKEQLELFQGKGNFDAEEERKYAAQVKSSSNANRETSAGRSGSGSGGRAAANVQGSMRRRHNDSDDSEGGGGGVGSEGDSDDDEELSVNDRGRGPRAGPGGGGYPGGANKGGVGSGRGGGRVDDDDDDDFVDDEDDDGDDGSGDDDDDEDERF